MIQLKHHQWTGPSAWWKPSVWVSSGLWGHPAQGWALIRHPETVWLQVYSFVRDRSSSQWTGAHTCSRVSFLLQLWEQNFTSACWRPQTVTAPVCPLMRFSRFYCFWWFYIFFCFKRFSVVFVVYGVFFIILLFLFLFIILFFCCSFYCCSWWFYCWTLTSDVTWLDGITFCPAVCHLTRHYKKSTTWLPRLCPLIRSCPLIGDSFFPFNLL